MINFIETIAMAVIPFVLMGVLIFGITGCTPAQVQQDVALAEEALEAGEQIYEGVYDVETKTIHLKKSAPKAQGFRQMKLRRIKEDKNF